MVFTICTYLIFPKFLGSNDLQSVMTNVSHLDIQLISGTYVSLLYQLDAISALSDLWLQRFAKSQSQAGTSLNSLDDRMTNHFVRSN